MANILSSPSGVQAEFNGSGALCRFSCDAISLSLFIGSELEGGLANLYLRQAGEHAQWTALLGPTSPTRFRLDPATASLTGRGEWQGVRYRIAFRLARAARAWFWNLRLENGTSQTQRVELIYAQDLALAPYGAVRMNEFYVSQYLDHTPLSHPSHGVVIASRQNAAVDGRYPWSLVGSLRSASGYATDALQFYGLAARAGEAPAGLLADLPAQRLQHEHSMAVIQDQVLELASGQSGEAGFFGAFMPDHPSATQAADLAWVESTLAMPEARSLVPEASPPAADAQAAAGANLFTHASWLNGRQPTTAQLQQLFTGPWRHAQKDAGGQVLSFFYGEDRHVVLQAKERRVLRPHGHLLRTGRHVTPDETALTSTVWMSGAFHSMLTQGHVSINRALSTTHSYLGLFRSHGQRVFIEVNDNDTPDNAASADDPRIGWHQLGMPSAFEMSPQGCRWIYLLENRRLEVRADALSDPHEMRLTLEILEGKAARFLISHAIALNGDDGNAPGAARWHQDTQGVVVSPQPGGEVGSRFPDGRFRILPAPGTRFARVGTDEMLFLDGASRQQPFVVVMTEPVTQAGLRIRGELMKADPTGPLRIEHAPLIPTLGLVAATTSIENRQAVRLADLSPWLTHNALVHYLSPRGLEQYSGGGWGTRDVCQGPLEMLLALQRTAPVRDLLLRVLRQQNPDGDWPQWFMFFERERGIRPGDSHGDIVFWPLLALAQYLIASGDVAVLDERLPFFEMQPTSGGKAAGSDANATVWEHVERALQLIEKRVIAGTALAAYGHGDWNDSLQPADPHLREHMCSAWTVTLNYQTLNTLAAALRSVGRTLDAAGLESMAQRVQRDFQRLLVVDGVLTGYALFEPEGVRYLLHPRDQTTGLKYSALGMIHAILEDMFTPEQVQTHLQLLDQQLSAPDGVRLFDRPMAYHGGPQRLFQRAESATFFGREIGLMYTHAHLRYAQAMAHLGESERFFKALCQANPIGIESVVQGATLRQSNCYYSSSDAAFVDRYQASEQYERVRQGRIAFDGGWRVYSSGAGIALSLIMRRFLGLNCEARWLCLDPVMPSSLDGLRAQTYLAGKPVEVTYRIGRAGRGVTAIEFNGHELAFGRRANPYRPGAAEVPMHVMTAALRDDANSLKVTLG